MLRNLLLLACLGVGVFSLNAQDFRTFGLPLNDICYSPVNDRLYAVQAGTNATGNAILVIDPADGDILQRIEVGSEPSLIRVSPNGRYLYVVLYGAPYLQRYDLTTGAFDPTLSLESTSFSGGVTSHFLQWAQDLEVLPGDGRSVVLSRTRPLTPNFGGIAVYDDLVVRPTQIGPTTTAGDRIEVADDGVTLWGVGHDYAQTGSFRRYQMDAQGVTAGTDYPTLLSTNDATHVTYQSGRMYLHKGQIYDVSGTGTPVLLTTINLGLNFGNKPSPMVPAIDEDVIYVLTDFEPTDPFENNFKGFQLKAYNKTTFALQTTHFVPDWYKDVPMKMVSLGQGRVAMLGTLNGRTKLVLYNGAPCPAQNLGLTLTPGPNVKVCAGDTLELQATPGYGTYFWSNGGTGSSIRVSASAALIDSFKYRVLAPNGCVSKPSPTVVVDFGAKPYLNYSVLGNRTTICPDEVAKFSVSVPGGGGNLVSVVFNGDTLPISQPLTTVYSGLYTVKIINQWGCVSDEKSITITQAHPDGVTQPTITASGPLWLCSGQSVTLSAPSGAFGYEWWNASATTPTFTPTATGDYAFRLKYPGGCFGPWSDTLSVAYKPLPTVPTLVQVPNSSSLRINNNLNLSDSVQWLFNNQPIPNTDTVRYTPVENGFYAVRNHWFGCTSQSAQFAYPQSFDVLLGATSNVSGLSSYQLKPTLSPSTGTYTYLWSDGSTQATLTVTQPGTYCVTVTRPSPSPTTTFDCVDVLPNDLLQARASYNSNKVEGMPMVLYRFDNPGITALNTLPTSADGKANFEGLATDVSYVFQAVPEVGSPLADLFLPTFNPNQALWTEAVPFLLKGLRVVGQNPQFVEVEMLENPMFTGDGTVDGFVIDGDGFAGPPASDGGAVVLNGTPLVGVSVFLYDSNGTPVGQTYTDANGYYVFNNLPPGTYTVWVNWPNVPPFAQTVLISAANPTASNVSFELIDGSFEVLTGTNTPTALRARVWPNPTTSVLNVETPETATLTVYDALGRLVTRQICVSHQRTQVPLDGQAAGLYFVYLQTAEGRSAVQRVVKQ